MTKDTNTPQPAGSLRDEIKGVVTSIVHPLFTSRKEIAEDEDKYIARKTEQMVQLITALIEGAAPAKSHISAQYSTSESDRFAYNLAYDSGVVDYHNNLLRALNGKEQDE